MNAFSRCLPSGRGEPGENDWLKVITVLGSDGERVVEDDRGQGGGQRWREKMLEDRTEGRREGQCQTKFALGSVRHRGVCRRLGLLANVERWLHMRAPTTQQTNSLID